MESLREGDFRVESGYQLARELLTSKPRPTALFVCNGMMTLGALNALEELGLRCPEDCALVTFDDLAVAAAFRPHLTAVIQPAYDMGFKAADLLLQRMEGTPEDAPPVHLILRPELRIRESSLEYQWHSQLAKGGSDPGGNRCRSRLAG